MVNLVLCDQELTSGILKPKHLREALTALRKDGYIVLQNAIRDRNLDLLRKRMIADVDEILRLQDVPFQFNNSHIQQNPPPFLPYLIRDILVNDFVVAITQALLGDGLHNSFYSGNTCLPGTFRQPLHVDVGQLWPQLKQATPAFGLVITVPVVDMSPQNGSTELWPGTHHDTTQFVDEEDIKIIAEDEERWRAHMEPIQPTVPAGGIVIRDIRLWHRGMPNHTDTPRPMIAMIHYIHWWQTTGPLHFPKGTESIFANSPLRTVAKFVDEPIEYLGNNSKYDYSPENNQ